MRETKQVNKMSDVYKNCPAFENDRFLLRFSQLNDASDLVSVYSDKNALPFFNSDNCHGDNFYYPNEERMREAIEFWLRSYSSKWFVRWTIIDKEAHKAIGSIEVFHRSANDDFNHVGVATVYKGNIIKNLIMDCQSYTKYRPNETTGGIFVSWRRKEELPTGLD